MATTDFVSGVTLSNTGWADDVDSTAYAVLTSVAGTNTITATGPANYAYAAARTPLYFVPAATNTGATTVNVTPSGGSALGAKNIFAQGAACVGGEIVSGVPCAIIYDGTQFNIVGFPHINALTADASPNGAADFVMTFDASATALKKVLLHRATKFIVSNFSRDLTAASGTQAVTGVGFAPKAVIFVGGINGTSVMSVGVDDGTTPGHIADDTVDSAGTYAVGVTESIVLAQAAGANQQGHITTLGSDGFTITWAKTGSPTGTATIHYLAFR